MGRRTRRDEKQVSKERGRGRRWGGEGREGKGRIPHLLSDGETVRIGVIGNDEGGAGGVGGGEGQSESALALLRVGERNSGEIGIRLCARGWAWGRSVCVCA